MCSKISAIAAALYLVKSCAQYVRTNKRQKQFSWENVSLTRCLARRTTGRTAGDGEPDKEDRPQPVQVNFEWTDGADLNTRMGWKREEGEKFSQKQYYNNKQMNKLIKLPPICTIIEQYAKKYRWLSMKLSHQHIARLWFLLSNPLSAKFTMQKNHTKSQNAPWGENRSYFVWQHV